MIDEYMRGALLLSDPKIREQHEQVKALIKRSKRLVFVGNGGSMSCCGHMAHDFLKVGQIQTLSPESASLLTCLSNDWKTLMFANWYRVQQQKDDLLFIVSSSGMSDNLIGLAEYANMSGTNIVTITGFSNNNRLGQMGNINIHLATENYGVHEIMSEIFLHSILDDIVAKHDKV